METEQLKKENVKLGYPVLADAIALVSQEIYSRFNAMLTANSIIIALIGLALVSVQSLPQPLPIVLPIAGLFLCIVWGFLNHQGVHRQHKYMEEARRLEQLFCGDFKIWLFEPHRWLSYYPLSMAIIVIFALIYVFLLVAAI